MLLDGLSYLNADEMAEVGQALAISIYAHSLNSNHGEGYQAVKVGIIGDCLVDLLCCRPWSVLVGPHGPVRFDSLIRSPYSFGGIVRAKVDVRATFALGWFLRKIARVKPLP